MEAKLLISFVIDNSAAVQGEKFNKIKSALLNFCSKMTELNSQNIEIEFVTFNEFVPAVPKTFDMIDYDMASLEPFKMPFLGKAISIALDDLFKRYEYYKKQETPLFKPWLFILTDAYSFDDLDEVALKLKMYLNESKILYMPFILSLKKIQNNIEALLKAKTFMRIKENCYDKFFDWFYDFAVKRSQTPLGVGVKFDKSNIEGWAVL